jgi:hypothetical protein
LRQTSSSTKTSCARTYRRLRCASMWQSAMRCCKISTRCGKVNSKNLRMIHFWKCTISNTNTKSKWKLWMSSWTERSKAQT